MIEDIVNEERKMHESLKKYKRGEDAKHLSDFEKMLIQFYVVRKYLI